MVEIPFFIFLFQIQKISIFLVKDLKDVLVVALFFRSKKEIVWMIDELAMANYKDPGMK